MTAAPRYRNAGLIKSDESIKFHKTPKERFNFVSHSKNSTIVSTEFKTISSGQGLLGHSGPVSVRGTVHIGRLFDSNVPLIKFNKPEPVDQSVSLSSRFFSPRNANR